MSLNQKSLSPVVRVRAALALVVFMAAQTLCFVHCNFGGGHGNSAPLSCHGAGAKAGHDEEDGSSSPSVPSPTTSCITLKTLLLGGDAPTLAAPAIHVLYSLTSFALAPDMTAPEPKVSFFGLANLRAWVFTPEVCLGPAHRSHAPPCLS
jgi:hypothetical protein